MVGNRPVLERIEKTGNVFMAWSYRPWLLEGAAVRVSMVGFDDGSEPEHTLDGAPVAQIHADLTAESNLTSALPLKENERLCFLGMMKGGPFDITEADPRRMLSRPLNPNGRPNSDVVRRRLGGRDITSRDSGGWLIDFGVNMPEGEAALHEWPFEYAKKHVIARADDYFFGVLHSGVHEAWSLSQGAWMGVGNDPRYSSAHL